MRCVAATSLTADRHVQFSRTHVHDRYSAQTSICLIADTGTGLSVQAGSVTQAQRHEPEAVELGAVDVDDGEGLGPSLAHVHTHS